MLAVMAWPRAIGLGAVVSVLSLTGHAVSGGHSGGFAATAAVIVATVLAARLLLAVPASPVRTTAFLVVAQLVSHLIARPVGHGSGHTPAHVAQSVHDHGDGLRRSVSPIAPALAEWVCDGMADLVSQPTMLVGHVLAAVVAAGWLYRGERLAMATMAMLWATIGPNRFPVDAVSIDRAAAAPIVAPVSSSFSRHLSTVLSRRGPPVVHGTVLAV